MKISSESGRFKWPIPFVGLRGISRSDLPREITSGFTLAALVIPLNIGYAQVAGLPATMGLYSALVPLVIFALFTSSRHVVGGPGPATAALVAEALEQTISWLDQHGITFAISRVQKPLRSLLQGYGLLDRIGSEREYATNREAAAAYRREMP